MLKLTEKLELDKSYTVPLTAKQLGLLIHVMRSNFARIVFARPWVQRALTKDLEELKMDIEFLLEDIKKS